MLPLMALCWMGLFFRFQGLEKELDAAVEARRDAWVASAKGCEQDEHYKFPSGIGIDCGGSNKDGSGWMQIVDKIPIVGFLVDSILGFEVEKVAERKHTAPTLLGGGTSQLAYSYWMMCNEKTRDLEWLLKALICQTTSSMGVSLSFAVDCPDPPSRGGAVCDK